MLAFNTSKLLYTRTETPSLFYTLSSTATSTCKVCYDPAQSTLRCPLLPPKVLPNIVVFGERHIKRKKDSDQQQPTSSSNLCLNSSHCFNNSRKSSSYSKRRTRVSLSACNELYPAKTKGSKSTVRTFVEHISDRLCRFLNTSEARKIDEDVPTNYRLLLHAKKNVNQFLFFYKSSIGTPSSPKISSAVHNL